jgi:hypothetical protein
MQRGVCNSGDWGTVGMVLTVTLTLPAVAPVSQLVVYFCLSGTIRPQGR